MVGAILVSGMGTSPPRTSHSQNFLCQSALWGKDFNTLMFLVLLHFSELFFNNRFDDRNNICLLENLPNSKVY